MLQDEVERIWWDQSGWIQQLIYLCLGTTIVVLIFCFLIPEVNEQLRARKDNLNKHSMRNKPPLPEDWCQHRLNLKGIGRGQAVFDLLRRNYKRTFYPLKEKQQYSGKAGSECIIVVLSNRAGKVWIRKWDPTEPVRDEPRRAHPIKNDDERLDGPPRNAPRYILSTSLPKPGRLGP